MTRTIEQLFDLRGRTALVSGGSRGAGLQLARALGEAGARLMLGARDADELEQASAELQAAGIDARWTAADCDSEAGIGRLAEATLQRMGEIDILVNNTGADWGTPAQATSLEAWDQFMNLRLRGCLLLSQTLVHRSMSARRAGRIINLAPAATRGGNGEDMDAIACNTARGALIHFTRALARQWASHNITVNAILPACSPHPADAGTLAASGDGEDLKGLCVLYASDAGRHITGQWLALDGAAHVLTGG